MIFNKHKINDVQKQKSIQFLELCIKELSDKEPLKEDIKEAIAIYLQAQLDIIKKQ